MTTKLAELILSLIPEDRPRKAIAVDWSSAWDQHEGADAALSLATVESRFSELTRGKPSGIRFFFARETVARGMTLLRVLGASDDRIAEAIAAAERELGGPAPPRLVVNLTPGPQKGPALVTMFEAVRDLFCGERRVRPMTWLMTASQYEGLPRSFDELRGDVVFEQHEAGEAAERARSLSHAGALVASPVLCGPPELWAGLCLEGRPGMVPEDALTTFEERGDLGWPVVERPLSRVATPTPNASLLYQGPLVRWELARRLASAIPVHMTDRGYLVLDAPDAAYLRRNEAHEVGAGLRLAWANAIGIEASATEKEWADGLDQRIAPIPLLSSDPYGDPTRLSDLLRNAELETRPVVFREGGVLHLVNPPPSLERDLASERVEVHRVAPAARGAVDEFLLRATRMSFGELLADPCLRGLASELASTDTERWAIDRARVALSLQQRLSPTRATALADWRSALDMLLGNAAPMRVLYRLRGRWESDSQRGRHEDPAVVRFAQFVCVGEPPADSAGWLPPLRGLVVARDQACWLVRPTDPDASAARRGEEAPGVLRLPRLGPDAAAWTESLCRTLVDESEHRSVDPAHTIALPPRTLQARRLEISDWDRWDQELALVVDALRRAMKSESGIPLPEGGVLLPTARGIVAEVRVLADPPASHAEVTAGFDIVLEPRDPAMNGGPFRATIAALQTIAGSSGRHADVPMGLWLAGGGVRAEISFRGSVFHG